MTPGLRVAERERVSVGEWIQAALLAANLVWTTLCLGGYRPETKLVTFTLTGVLLVLHLVICAVEKRSVRRTSWSGWWLLPFLAYALINVLSVTPVSWLGWMDWLGWGNMIAVFWVMLNGIPSRAPRRMLFLTLVSLGIGAVLLGSYQRFVQPEWLMLGRRQAEQFLGRASGPFGIPNSFAGFLLLLLPATGALALRRAASATERVWWGWATAVLAFGMLVTVSRGGWLALALALLVWPLTIRHLKWKWRALAAALTLAVLAAAAAVTYQAVPKVRDRFAQLVQQSGELSRPILWRAAWDLFRAQPLAGSGAGSFNVMFEQHRPSRFRDEPQWVHNEYLNTLSDYGALGFVLFFGACVAIAARRACIDRTPSLETRTRLDSTAVHPGLNIGLLAFALQLVVDFHLKIPGVAMAFAVVAALALGRPVAGTIHPGEGRAGGARIGWMIAGVVVALGLLPMARFYRAEAFRYGARQSLDAYTVSRAGDLLALLECAERDLSRATSLAPQHAGAWADLAFALELRAFAEPARAAGLAEPAVSAARRATELSPAVAEFWIRLGVAFDLQAQAPLAEKAFGTALRLAPRNSNAWYYYAYHLSLDTKTREAALRAIANSLSLDPGNAAAEALYLKLNGRS